MWMTKKKIAVIKKHHKIKIVINCHLQPYGCLSMNIFIVSQAYVGFGLGVTGWLFGVWVEGALGDKFFTLLFW